MSEPDSGFDQDCQRRRKTYSRAIFSMGLPYRNPMFFRLKRIWNELPLRASPVVT